MFVEADAAGSLMFYGAGAGAGRPRAPCSGTSSRSGATGSPGPAGPDASTYARLPVLPIGEARTSYYVALDVADRPGVLAPVAETFARHGVSIRAVRQEGRGEDAKLVIVTHIARGGGAARDRGRTGHDGRRPRGGQRDASRGRGEPVSEPADRGARTKAPAAAAVTAVARRDRAVPAAAAGDRRTPVITLGEGATPLLPAPVLSERTGCEVYLKVEGANPTGSFKDRGMTMAVSMAVSRGATAVICASTGNTSASAAAYAARAGWPARSWCRAARSRSASWPRPWCTGPSCSRWTATSTTASNWPGSWPPITRSRWSTRSTRTGWKARRARRSRSWTRSATPRRALPAGRQRGQHLRLLDGLHPVRRGRAGHQDPRMLGFQASGAAPIVRGEPVRAPQTIATAIRIGNPASWGLAEAARDASGGLIDSVTDRQIFAAYRLLAARRRSSASWRRRPGWPGCSRRGNKARWRPVRGWCAR